MRARNFFELVSLALPPEITVEDLRNYLSPDLWEAKSGKEFEQPLRQWRFLNWQAYLENNPDLKAVGMDPVRHFLKHGVYEGRRLYGYNPLVLAEKAPSVSTPKVSIIVPNYNNAIFLDKCLRSLVSQTLREIQIIVVDDGSGDDSLKVIKKYAAQDRRIILIRFENNLSQHMAKKAAVLAATGDFIMFLDSDDFYVHNACEIAYNAIIKGYDMVNYGVAVINHGKYSPDAVAQLEKQINWADKEEYKPSELLDLCFMENKMNKRLTNKIIARAICKAAFSEMESGHFTLADDYYQYLVLLTKIRSQFHIPDKLYQNRYGIGSTNLSASKLENEHYINLGNVLPSIERFCHKNGLMRFYEAIKITLFKGHFRLILSKLEPDQINKFFDTFGKNYGALFTVKYALVNCGEQIEFLADKFRHYSSHLLYKKPEGEVKRFAIFYHSLSFGGIEITIKNIASILLDKGYEVNLFVENKSEDDIEIDPRINIYYINPTQDDLKGAKEHLNDIYNALTKAKIDVLIYMGTYRPVLFFDLMLAHLLGIKFIGAFRTDYIRDFILLDHKFDYQHQIKTMRCMDKLFCISEDCEVLFRMNGIDAIYIPNMIRTIDVPVASAPGNDIVIIGRLSDRLKRIGQCLKVLKETRMECLDATMTFVGDFANKKSRLNFQNELKRLGLEGAVKVTGWVENPEYFIARSKVLFSASWLEGFPNGVAEAQAMGKPVVMYALNIMMTENNPSIIMVPQGDYKAAAHEIALILNNDKLREELSAIARSCARQFSKERFGKNVMDLLENLDLSSKINNYAHENVYKRIINNIAFYSGRRLPPRKEML